MTRRQLLGQIAAGEIEVATSSEDRGLGRRRQRK